MKAIFTVLKNSTCIDGLVEKLKELGIAEGTIIRSTDFTEYAAQSSPMLRLAQSLSDPDGGEHPTLVFCVEDRFVEAILDVIEEFTIKLVGSGSGMAFVLPIEETRNF